MATNLRDRIEEDPPCKRKFDEAESLARSLFDLTKPGKKMIPFFTDHTPTHMEKVEENLNRIIYWAGIDERAFVPSAEEAMYLLSACWLHDIGMIFGIFDGENASGPDIDWAELRKEHERRSAEYVTGRWQQNCAWSRTEKNYLAEICFYHRQAHPLAKMELAVVDGKDNQPVRMRELAAMLRLADACHIDETRAPVDLKNLFDSYGMPASSQEHWGIPRLIHKVEFDHRSGTVPLHCLLPPPERYGTATIDFETVIDRLVDALKRELDSVVPWLSAYSNTNFKAVESRIVRLETLAKPEGLIMDLWPSIIKMFSSASEAACMVAALVMAACRDCSEPPKAKIFEMLDMAIEVHPYNFLIRELDRQVRELLNKGASVGELRKCKVRFLKEREDRCVQVARQARRAIDNGDAIVVSGYSHTVLTLLTEQMVGHRGTVLVVRCPPTRPSLIARDANRRLLKGISSSGLTCVQVESADLMEIFQHFKRTGQAAKVLLSAQGVFNGGDVLAAVGCSLISLAAKAAGFPVYVLADPEKRISDKETSAKIESLLAKQADRLISIDSDGDKPAQIAARIDCLAQGMYDQIIGSEPIQVEPSMVGNDS